MFPWLWFWAPQFHYPLSGNVEQDIEAFTRRWFNAIPANAGDGNKEWRAFRAASYGTQLGVISKLLLSLTEDMSNLNPKSQALVQELLAISERIENAKHDTQPRAAESLLAEIERLKSENSAQFENLSKKLLPLLS